MNTDHLIEQIGSIVEQTNWKKVLFFGSRAQGLEANESDVDVYVVTGDDFTPQSYDEKLKIKVEVSKHFKKLREYYPVDLIVHTYPMYEQFKKQKSSFSRRLFDEGITLR